MAFLTIYKVSSLVAKGLPMGIAVYKLGIYRPSIRRNYSRASCIACYEVSYGQYKWYGRSCGLRGGIAGRSCGTYNLIQGISGS